MSKFENFIYINDDVISEEFCKEVFNFTNNNLDSIKELQSVWMNPAEDTLDAKIKERTDFNYYWAPYSLCTPPIHLVMEVVNVITGGLKEYAAKYPAISLITPYGLEMEEIKYHVVKSGEGYHGWHSEWHSSPPQDKRILVWHIALTSHENEGELEFLYHKERITAKAGRLIIWPAFFPWIHRGNAIRTDTEKHYLTGWFHTSESRNPQMMETLFPHRHRNVKVEK